MGAHFLDPPIFYLYILMTRANVKIEYDGWYGGGGDKALNR